MGKESIRDKNKALETSSIVFAAIGLAHAWRLISGGVVSIDGMQVPTWMSGLLILVCAYMSWWAWKASRE